jgi:alkylmercury lyase
MLTTPSLRSFNERLLFSCPELDADEVLILRAAYDGLLEGDPFTPGALAVRANLSSHTVNAIIARRPGVARYASDERIHGYLGLSLEPTPHAIEIGDRKLWVWCAWDGLFIPRILGATARLTSTCPITGHPVMLVVSADGILEASPITAVMSFLGSLGPAGNGVGACCPFIHFLQSDKAGAHWQSSHPSGCVLNLEQAWQLAQTFVDARLSVSLPNVPSVLTR